MEMEKFITKLGTQENNDYNLETRQFIFWEDRKSMLHFSINGLTYSLFKDEIYQNWPHGFYWTTVMYYALF